MRIGDAQGFRQYKNIDEVFARQGNGKKDKKDDSGRGGDAAVNRLSDEKLVARYEKVAERYERLKQKLEKRGLPSSPPNTTTPQSTSTPGGTSSTTATAPTSSNSTSSNVDALAKKYVEIYEKNSGTILTQDQREAKISDVSAFYSESGREGRLAQLVNAF